MSATDFRDALRRVAWTVRSIPGQLGARPYTVDIVVTTSSGAELGEGTRTAVTTRVHENGQPPKVRWLTDRELALAGYATGTVEIGPITPEALGCGTSIDTLHPEPPVNTTVRVLLTGPEFPAGAHFRIRQLTHHRSWQYLLTCERCAS